MFLFASFIIFIATSRNVYTSILLMLASAYSLVDLIPQLWKEIKKYVKR